MAGGFFEFLSHLLNGIAGATKRAPAGPAPKPLVSKSLNVFAGSFASELEATDYGMGFGDGPSLSADLGGAGIGPDDIEVIYGADRITAATPMLRFVTGRRPARDANTYLLLTDRGYDVDALSGETVRFIGKCDVS